MIDGVWVDQAGDRLIAGDAGRDEYRQHHEQARPALRSDAAQRERYAEGEGGRGVADVVDQVSVALELCGPDAGACAQLGGVRRHRGGDPGEVLVVDDNEGRDAVLGGALAAPGAQGGIGGLPLRRERHSRLGRDRTRPAL